MNDNVQLVCGLMSGTSCDAVDAALVWTDGYDHIQFGPTAEVDVPVMLRNKIRTLQTWADASFRSSNARQRTAVFQSSICHTQREVKEEFLHPLAIEIEEELTSLHVQAVQAALSKLSADDLIRTPLSLIGYHGNTICHFPPSRHVSNLPKQFSPFTWQLGDGQSLSDALQVPVVFRFRDNDIIKGNGEGAPLAPAYHRALCTSKWSKSSSISGSTFTEIAVLNIGGVSNLTMCRIDSEAVAEDVKDTDSSGSNNSNEHILAFDVGPGNALLDDFMMKRTGKPMDPSGAMAKKGTPDIHFIQSVMNDDEYKLSQFLTSKAPKSCDRDQFAAIHQKKSSTNIQTTAIEEMTLENGAATLTLLTAKCIGDALSRVPSWTASWSTPMSSAPNILVVTGGGRKNDTLMELIAVEVGSEVQVMTADEAGWRGDSVEAEAFAYLAVRSILNLSLSWPSTTGTTKPITGGILVSPSKVDSNKE